MLKRFLYRGYWRSAVFTQRWQRRLTPGGGLVLAGFLICGGLGIDTNQAMAYQAFALFGAALLIAALGQWRSLPRLELRRELPRYGSVGIPFTYRVRVANHSSRTWRGLSLFEDVGDPRPSLEEFSCEPEPGEEQRNWFDRALGYYRWIWLLDRNRRASVPETPLPVLPGRAEVETTLELLPLRRGLLRLGRAEIAFRDPFGLSRRLQAVSSSQSVLVLPKRYQVPPIALPGTVEYQPGGVALASAVGESEEFVTLRDYRRGDPLRHVHWKSTARSGRLIVKEFQDEFFVRHALVLDTFQRGRSAAVFEEAVSVAASLACTVQSQDSLLDLLFVGPRAYCFTAGRGLGQTEQLLEILAAVEPCREKPFHTLEDLVLEHLPRVSGAIGIFLSWDESRREFVRKIKAAGVPLRVLVMVEPGQTAGLDPGPMADQPREFRVLEVGRVAEGLLP